MKAVHLSKKDPSRPRRAVWKSWGIVILFCVLAVSFSGCDLLQDLGLTPEDEPAEEPEPGPEPGPEPAPEPAPTKPKVIAACNPSIKAKFGITATEKAGVTATFTTLHAYIQTGGLNDNVIRLGDWIDLEGGLQVDAYDGYGGFTATNTHLGDKGRLLRLIVVGINSFHSGRGMADSDTITQNGDTNGQYAVTDNDSTPHVVFQFQNVPVTRRMNSGTTNAGGYRDSEMRRYLTDVAEDGNSGKFLEGLKNAGVPVETALWAPRRIVSVKNGPGVIEDLLWLPTERELFGSGTASVSADETEGNQARLEYYTDKDSRAKFLVDGPATITVGCVNWWWVASPSGTYNSTFCGLDSGGDPFGSAWADTKGGGCVPAFCVR